MRLFGAYFWGLLFIVIGVAFIIKYVFNLNIPIISIIIGFILIYFGIAVIAGGFSVSTKKDVVFDNRNIKVENPDNEYNIVFSNGTVDLSGVKPDGMNRTIKVHTVFANGTVRVNPDIPAVIKVSSAFGTANVPNTSVTFGEYTYKTRGYREGEPYLKIEADTVFGKLDIVEW